MQMFRLLKLSVQIFVACFCAWGKGPYFMLSWPWSWTRCTLAESFTEKYCIFSSRFHNSLVKLLGFSVCIIPDLCRIASSLEISIKPVQSCRTWWLAGTQTRIHRQDSQKHNNKPPYSGLADVQSMPLVVKWNLWNAMTLAECSIVVLKVVDVFRFRSCAGGLVQLRVQPQPSRRPSCDTAFRLLLQQVTLSRLIMLLAEERLWLVQVFQGVSTASPESFCEWSPSTCYPERAMAWSYGSDKWCLLLDTWVQTPYQLYSENKNKQEATRRDTNCFCVWIYRLKNS